MKKGFGKIVSGLLFSGVMFLTLGTAAKAADKPIVFRMSIVDSEATPYYKGAVKIAEEVAKATDNKIQIKVIAGGALGGERDNIEQAMAGDLDIATAANSVLTNWIPEMGILDQAYLWDNTKQAHAAVDGKLGELINAKAEKKGIHVIGYMESAFRDIFSKKPIEKIEDLKGVKIRTMQNKYHMAAFEAFGALPTPMAANEQFTALQQGAIDACENAVTNCLANGLYEVTKNITYSKHAYVFILVCMSDNAWKQIPDDLKEPFLKAVKAGCNAERQILVESNENAAKELKEKGVTFHTIDIPGLREEYQKAAKAKGFTFDPEWEAAVKEAIDNNK